MRVNGDDAIQRGTQRISINWWNDYGLKSWLLLNTFIVLYNYDPDQDHDLWSSHQCFNAQCRTNNLRLK